MATIDNLEIKISANVNAAVQSTDKLIASLSELENKLSIVGKGFHLNTSGFVQQVNAATKAFSEMANATEEVIKKVSKIKIENFNTEGFKKITDAFSSAAKIPDVSDSVNRMVSSIARLASAGDKISIVNKEIPSLTANLKKAMEDFCKTPNISEPTNIFVRSISQLANAGNKTSQTTAQLKLLQQSVMDFFQTISRVPQINDATIRTMEALSRLASAGNRTSSSFRGMQAAMSASRHGSIALGSALKAVVAMLTKVLTTIKNVSVITVKSAVNVRKLADSMSAIGTSTRSATNSMKSFVGQLSAAAGVYLSLYGAVRGFKNSIETASSLTEIQNVIDVTFGNAKQKIEDLAAVSITDFGMSELTTKQIAGRFQGMGKAAGFATDKMADMSVDLTKLAADMASFYDVNQKDIAKSLESVFTGTAAPLRRYGLDITQATLQSWLLKRGIDADVRSMSQMEKIMLRYQYVMANTTAAQGDFARTANTWANQVRVLKQSFEVLGSTIGGVLINVLKPFVVTLNKLMLKINDFAKIVAESLGTIFGWTYEAPIKGIVNDFEDSIDGTADNLEKADKSAKELKRTILGFDQLNLLSDNSKLKDGISSFSELEDALAGGIDSGAWKQNGDTLVKSFHSDLNTLEKLGEEIGKKLTSAMNSIDWDIIYSKASSFGTGLASFLNGLISPELFGALGSTIAGSLNTAFHFLNDFGTDFEWKNFGKSLMTGLKKFLSTFDWNLAVETFNTLTNGILDAIIAALGKVSMDDWKKVAQKIADMIDGIDAKNILWKLGKIVNSFANAFYVLVSNKQTWLNLGNKIAEGINGFLKGMNKINEETGLNGWQALGKGLSKAASGIITTIITTLKQVRWKKIGKAIFDFISSIEWSEIGIDLGNMINALSKAIIKLVGKPEAWREAGEKLADGFNKFFETLKPEDLAAAANAIVDNLKAAIAGFMRKLKWKDILDKTGKFLGNLDLDTIAFTVGSFMLLTKAGRKLTSKLFKNLIMTPIINLFTSAFGSGAVSSAAAGLSSVAIPVGIGLAISLKSVEWKESLDEVEEKLRKAFKTGNISDYFSADLEKIKNPYGTINAIGGGILDNTNRPTIEDQKKALEKNGSWFGGMMTTEEVQENVKMIKDKITEFWGEKVKLPVEGSLKNAKENVEQWKSDIKQKWNNLKLAVSNKLETTKENLNEFKETLKEKWGMLKLGIKNKLETTGEDITAFYDKIKKWWGEKKLKIGNTLATLKSDIADWWSKVKDWWGERTLSIKVVFDTVKDKIKGIADSIGNFFSGSSSKSSAGNYSLRGVNMTQYEPADLGWYAKGGLFNRASVIGVGEAGKEAVLPLTDTRAMSMIADSIMANMSTQNATLDIKQAVMEGVVQAMMMNQGNNKSPEYIQNSIYLDGDVMARAVTKSMANRDYRFNPTPKFGY